ncbi:MAG TPA: DNA/RNA non-specific endonuclease [Staphylococcus sp.]|nr:DNA/RNA non-specific endonuclease [Staphylococcus sp.]
MKKTKYLILLLMSIFIIGCSNGDNSSTNDKDTTKKVATEIQAEKETSTAKASEKTKTEPSQVEAETTTNTNESSFPGYKEIKVDGGDLSGDREANVVVDIGYGDRKYWAFTNEHGQLTRVVADEITLQDENNEDVLPSGRYYSDEAKVPGVESDTLDEGHVIADSLGGVSNAYNITPQNSTLNRYGDQAYLEKSIREAGGATNFEANITYPDTETQIPSSYQYTYTINGNVVTDSFDNVDPDEVNESLGLTGNNDEGTETTSETVPDQTSENKTSLTSVDTDGNGQVTISEAKAAGFTMPITSEHWLYVYMDDRDNDGEIGE